MTCMTILRAAWALPVLGVLLLSNTACDGEAIVGKSSSAGEPGAGITWNPLDLGLGVELSEDDLRAMGYVLYEPGAVRANVGKRSGRWYWEVQVESVSPNWYTGTGVTTREVSVVDTAGIYEAYGCSFDNTGLAWCNGGYWWDERDAWQFAAGDVIGIALDLDEHRVAFSKNGRWIQGDDHIAANLEENEAERSIPDPYGDEPFWLDPGWDYAQSTYYPFANHALSDVHLGRFGKHSFDYEPPDGFRPLSLPDEPQEYTPAFSMTCTDFDTGTGIIPSDTSSWVAEERDFISSLMPQMRILSMYAWADLSYNSSLPPEDIDVHIGAVGPTVLVLDSQRAKRWLFTIDPSAQLQKILLTGNPPTIAGSEVVGAEGIPVEMIAVDYHGCRLTPEAPGCFGHGAKIPGGAYNDPGSYMRKLEAYVEAPIASFEYCNFVESIHLEAL